MLQQLAQKQTHRIFNTKTLSFILLSVFVGTIVLTTIPARAVTTAASKQDDLDWQIKSWWYARTLENCWKNSNTFLVTGAREVASGEFWSMGDWSGSSIYGAYMSNTLTLVDKQHQVCSNTSSIISKMALNHWGISALELICSTQMQNQGAYKRSGGRQDCATGDNDFDVDKDAAARGVINYVTQVVNGGTAVYKADASDLPPAAQYVFWRDSLIRVCTTGTGSASIPGGSSNMRYAIQTDQAPPAGPTANAPIYTYYTATGDRSHTWQGHALPNGNKTSCQTMQDKANANYAAYARAVANSSVVAVTPGGSSGGGTTADEADPCDAIFAAGDGGGMALRWLTCPVMKSLSWVTDTLNTALGDLLRFDMSHFENQGFHNVWKNFRNIALALLVIAALVMIVSQAAGAQILDAYTIKKVLPRLLIAVVAISLSWPLLKFGVQLFNDLGGMVNNLILQPFTSVATSAADQAMSTAQRLDAVNGTNIGQVVAVATGLNDAIQTGAGVGLLAGGTLATGAAALAIYGPLGVLSIVGVAVLALIVAVLALGLRAIIIIAGIVLAPLAIACFILPSTEKIWKFWWNLMIGALAMFPIVMGFLALGKAGAMITPNPLLAILLFIAPYFLIPFAFKLGSGFVGKVMTAINDSERGLFDRAKKFRGAQSQKNIGEMLEGKRFKGDGAFSAGLNRATGHVGSLRNIRNGSVKDWGKQIYSGEQAHSDAAAQKEFKENMAFAAIKGDDDLVRAMWHGKNEADISAMISRDKGYTGATLQSAVQNVMAARSSMSDQVRGKAAHMALAASGTGYKDAADMVAGARLAAGGDRAATERMAFTGRGLMSQARPDSNLSAADLMSAVNDTQNGTMTTEKQKDYAIKALMNSDDTTIARSKGQTHNAVRTLFEEHVETLNKKAKNNEPITAEEYKTAGKLLAKVKNVKATTESFGNTNETMNYNQLLNKSYIKDLEGMIDSGVNVHLSNGYNEALASRNSYDPRNSSDPRTQQPPKDNE